MVLRTLAVLWAVVRTDELGHEPGNCVGVDRLTPAGREDVIVPDTAPRVAHPELIGDLVRRPPQQLPPPRRHLHCPRRGQSGPLRSYRSRRQRRSLDANRHHPTGHRGLDIFRGLATDWGAEGDLMTRTTWAR